MIEAESKPEAKPEKEMVPLDEEVDETDEVDMIVFSCGIVDPAARDYS